MQIEVVEFELTCRAHGAHKLMIPAGLPQPRNCAHCFERAERREIRRIAMGGPIPGGVSSEAFIG